MLFENVIRYYVVLVPSTKTQKLTLGAAAAARMFGSHQTLYQQVVERVVAPWDIFDNHTKYHRLKNMLSHLADNKAWQD